MLYPDATEVVSVLPGSHPPEADIDQDASLAAQALGMHAVYSLLETRFDSLFVIGDRYFCDANPIAEITVRVLKDQSFFVCFHPCPIGVAYWPLCCTKPSLEEAFGFLFECVSVLQPGDLDIFARLIEIEKKHGSFGEPQSGIPRTLQQIVP